MKTKNKEKNCPLDYNVLYGYDLEELARVAALMETCGVLPQDIKKLSNNIIALYGVIMKGIKDDFKITKDSIIMQCRYPSVQDVLRGLEEENK